MKLLNEFIGNSIKSPKANFSLFEKDSRSQDRGVENENDIVNLRGNLIGSMFRCI